MGERRARRRLNRPPDENATPARAAHRNPYGAPVPIPAGLKRSILKDWPNRQFGIADLDPEGNFAIRLVRRSGDLVDADLDCEEAIELAPTYLPRTGATLGRKSKPRSHWRWDPHWNLDSVPLAEIPATMMPREAEVPQATAHRIRPPEGMSPYAEAALDRACRRIVGAPNGEQETTINAEALSISTPSDLSEGQS